MSTPLKEFAFMHTDSKRMKNRIQHVFLAAILIFCIIASLPTVNVKGDEDSSRQSQDVNQVLHATIAKLADTVKKPGIGTSDDAWIILCLARGGYYAKENVYFTDYYNHIVEYVNTKAGEVNLNGALHKVKSTDNSRLILALSSIGRDATKVGNWDLTAPYEDFKWIKKQGINGPVFSLIALDTNHYQTKDTTLRQQCIDLILEKQLEDGGWALSGKTADPDITAMTLQSLYPYKDQTEVSSAAEKAFSCLSDMQNSDGGYASWGTVNSESCSQVIVALTVWGINPDTDSRFVKNNKSVIDAVLTYYNQGDAAFKHVLSGNSDAIATEQACYALVAYDRFINGKASLYDMSDAFRNEESKEDEPPQEVASAGFAPPDNTENKSDVQKPKAQERLSSPETGDRTSWILYFTLTVFSAAALFFSLIKLKKEANR